MATQLPNGNRHVMDMNQLQDALSNTPRLVEKYGIQFQDGNRLISIPPEFAFDISHAVADALERMIAEKEISGQN